MAGTNTYEDMTALIRDYMTQSVANYLDQAVTINEVSLQCDIYRVADNTALTNSVFTGCTAVDANTQIIIGRNLSIESGVTLTPPYRCKGVIIGSPGQFTNEGTISMTARGASGAGKNIQLTSEQMISATGGSGGAGLSSESVGNTGNTASTLSCAGGGSGGRSATSTSGSSGAGGTGTSFSGGAGGGGSYVISGSNGSSTGGAGGAGGTHSSGSSDENGGGAGNPGGSGNGSGGSTSSNVGSDGTGGLLVIFSDILNQYGTLSSNGSNGGGTSGSYAWCAGGGGSGAGCIVLISKSSSITGTYTVTGGSGGVASSVSGTAYAKNGGAGGNGTYSAITDTSLVISNPSELSLALTMEQYLEDVEPVDGRLLGLMDTDELMYEYAGERHRAMRTDADFSEFTSRGQRTPDELEVSIDSPVDGQVITYDATTQKWKNESKVEEVSGVTAYLVHKTSSTTGTATNVNVRKISDDLVLFSCTLSVTATISSNNNNLQVVFNGIQPISYTINAWATGDSKSYLQYCATYSDFYIYTQSTSGSQGFSVRVFGYGTLT